MPTQPLVSVLMPCFNAGQYLYSSISSVLNQTYSNLELIVVDDGSTDSSLAVASCFNDDRVRVIKNETNLGIVTSRNIGISHAKGELLACLDADDIALPERIELQVKFMSEDPELALLGSSAYLIDESGVVFDAADVPETHGDICRNILRGNSIIHSSVMMRANIVKLLGGYVKDYSLAEDYALWIKIASGYKVSNLPERLVKYRVHSSQISQTALVEMRKVVSAIQTDSWLSIKESGNVNKILEPIAHTTWSKLRGHAGTLGYDHLYWAQHFRRMGCWSNTIDNIFAGIRLSPLCLKFYWLFLPLCLTPWFWGKRKSLRFSIRR